MQIEINGSYVMEIDDEDFPLIGRYAWEVRIDPKNGRPYAKRRTTVMGKKTTIFAHRVVMGVKPGDAAEVDHRDHRRTLDNRKENLRIATRSQNNCNRGMRKDNTSGIKGVYFDSRNSVRPWYAKIMLNKRSYHLGRYELKEQAAEAYRDAALRLHGEFACIVRSQRA